MTQWVDPTNNAVTLSYDYDSTVGKIRLKTITDPLGKNTYIHYDDPNNSRTITSVSNDLGKSASFSYTGGKLTQITDPVALTFDHDGGLYVCEMRGYSNDGYGTGTSLGDPIEVSSLAPDTEDAARDVITNLVGTLAMYLTNQMSAGRLRQMHPLLALQSFAGPIFFHLITRPAAERVLGIEIGGEEAVTELAEAWLRGMSPEEKR